MDFFGVIRPGSGTVALFDADDSARIESAPAPAPPTEEELADGGGAGNGKVIVNSFISSPHPGLAYSLPQLHFPPTRHSLGQVAFGMLGLNKLTS